MRLVLFSCFIAMFWQMAAPVFAQKVELLAWGDMYKNKPQGNLQLCKLPNTSLLGICTAEGRLVIAPKYLDIRRIEQPCGGEYFIFAQRNPRRANSSAGQPPMPFRQPIASESEAGQLILFSDYYLYGLMSAQTLQDWADNKTMRKGGEKVACPYIDIRFLCPQPNLVSFLLTTDKGKKQLAYFEQISQRLQVLPQQWANIELIEGQYLKLKKGNFFGLGQLLYPQGLQMLLPESYDSINFIGSTANDAPANTITILAQKQSKWAMYNLLGKAITGHSYSQYIYQAEAKAFLLQTLKHTSKKKNNKWGLVQVQADKLQQLLPFSYDSISILSNKSGTIHDAIALKKGQWGVLMDIYKLPQQRLAFQYQQIIAITTSGDNIEYLAQREGKTEYWTNGQLRPIVGEFSQIGRALSPNLRIVKHKNKSGLLQTKTLNIVCPTIYDEISELQLNQQPTDSSDAPSFLRIRSQQLVGLYAVDRETVIIPAAYDSINYLSPQIAQIWRSGKVGGFDLYNNTEIISPEFDEIQILKSQYLPNAYLLRQGENWGLWRQGAPLLACLYDSFYLDSREEFLILNKLILNKLTLNKADSETLIIDLKRLAGYKNTNLSTDIQLNPITIIVQPIANYFAPQWTYNIGQIDSLTNNLSRISTANGRVYITTQNSNAPFLMLDSKGNALTMPAQLTDFKTDLKANEKPLSFVLSADANFLFYIIYTNAAFQLHALKLKTSNNATIWQPLWQQDLTEPLSAGFCLIDIDKDKKPDPVLIFNKNIIAYSTNTGRRLWAYAAPFPLTGQAYTMAENRDKIANLFIANLQISGKNGQPIGAITPPNAAPPLPAIFTPAYPPQIVQFAKQKPAQTLIVSDNGYLLLLPINSNQISLTLRLPALLAAPPIVADIDGDGLLELLLHCKDGVLYCYKASN